MAPTTSKDEKVTFRPVYDVFQRDYKDLTVLFLGAANTLYYPMKKTYLSPALISASLHPTMLVADSMRSLNSNANLNYGGASSGDTEARSKGQGWSEIWNE